MSLDQQDRKQNAGENCWQPQPQPLIQPKVKLLRLKSHALASVVLAGFLILTGCSTGNPAQNASTPMPSPTPAVNCETASMEEWLEHCDTATVEGEPSAEPGAVTEDHKIPKGQVFEYTSVMADGPGTTWSIKLAKTECGLNSLPKTDGNPKWQGGDEVPEYIPAKAPKGSDFCVLYWDWENTGKRPGTTIQSGDLMFGDEFYARSSEDEMRSWTFMETNLSVGYTDEVNPHKQTKSADIYTVDEGAVPDAVMFPMETMVDEEYFLVATR
jgi:hypothetical protein